MFLLRKRKVFKIISTMATLAYLRQTFIKGSLKNKIQIKTKYPLKDIK